jgi:surface protein
MLGLGLKLNKSSVLKPTSTLMQFDTSKAGSASTHLVLPFVSAGTYACTVKWGDGTQNYITAYNDAALDHVYPASGVYNVEIIGTCNGFRFNGVGDKLKLMVIKRWGKDFRLGNLNSYFLSCANLTVTATDILNLTGTTDLSIAFRGCSNIITIPSMNSWNTSAVTNMGDMFRTASKFNQNISSWNVANVTTMSTMFQDAAAFNQNIGGWNTIKVANMSFMLYGCTAFNQNIGGFNIAALTNATNMMQNKGALSVANYDALLIGWAAQTVHANVAFHAGTSKYDAGGSAAAARAVLVGSPNNWTITDSGTA